MSLPFNNLPQVIWKTWSADERYASPLSSGQRKIGLDVAVGVIETIGVVVRVPSADADEREAAEAAEDLEDAAAGSGVESPGNPGRRLVVGTAGAVEMPLRMLLLSNERVAPEKLMAGREETPVKEFDMAGGEMFGI